MDDLEPWNMRKVCESLYVGATNARSPNSLHYVLCVTHFVVEWVWISFAFYLCSRSKQSSWCFSGSISLVPSFLCVTYRMASVPRGLWISNSRRFTKLGVCHLIRIRYPHENCRIFYQLSCPLFSYLSVNSFILCHRSSKQILKKLNGSSELLGFLDFFHCLMFLWVETRRFGNWICFRPQVKGGEDTYSAGPLRKS
jgi:hypothetical protein